MSPSHPHLSLVPRPPPHDPTAPADASPPDDPPHLDTANADDVPGLHRWRVNDGPDDDPTHGYGAECQVCGMELVPCVTMVGRTPVAGLFIAGRARVKYETRKHGRCPGPPARCGDDVVADAQHGAAS